MYTLSKNQVKLYETLEDVRVSEPYAIEDADELSRVISCFVAWAQMIATHPGLATNFRDPTAHIRLATDLRKAMKFSQENRLYPNIVLPMSKYFSAKLLRVISQSIGPEIAAMIEQENQRWAEEYSI
jgi:hypothetical protein